MPLIPFTHHPGLNLVESLPRGEVRLEDLLRTGRRMLDDGVMGDGTIEYLDLSGLTNVEIDYVGIRSLRALLEDWRAAGWRGTLLHCPSDEQFCMARMITAALDSLPGATPGARIPVREPVQLEDAREFLEHVDGARVGQGGRPRA